MKTRHGGLVVIVLLVAVTACAGEVGYYRFPTIHGERIVFAAEGDLWAVSTAGGAATRLTTHDGNEGFPKLSPDGKWLAFSGEYQGNVDVYVMPAEGGEPRRLTYHPVSDEVIAWRPDSQRIVFRSHRLSPNGDYNLFEISREGGHPQPIPVGIAALASFSPDDKYIAFNPFSDEFRNWKRYLGGTAQDVWVGDLEQGTFCKITDWPGTDTFPMWHDGRPYFVSDRNGRMNLFSTNPDGSDVKPLTKHEEYDVRWPDMDAGRVVYMNGGDLWLLDVANGQSRKLDITLTSDRMSRRAQPKDAGETLEGYDLDKDGKRLCISSRGELWVRPTKPGRMIQLTQSSGVRERSGVYSRDGKRVACITDETGEQELAIFDATGKEPHRILTHRGKGWIFDPVWSPDGMKLAYADLTMALFVVDVESGDVRPVDKCDVWEIRYYEFSPDGKWLAYVKAERNHYHSISLYNVADGTTQAVTEPFSDNFDPTWDPKGKFLYFLSDRRINPVLDRGGFDLQHIMVQATRPCIMILAKEGKSPLLPDELLDKEPKKEKEKGEDAEKEQEEEEELPEMVIDLEGLPGRVVELPVPADNYSDLRAVEGKLLYVSSPIEGLLDERWPEKDETPRGKLHVYSFKDRKDEVVVEALQDYTLSGNGERIAYRVKDEIEVFDLDSLKPGESGKDDEEADKEKIDPADLPLLVNPVEEWAQIFAEAWRLQRDFYWAENMASIDWPVMRERYGRLLPRIGTRQELNDLIGQLLGELGTSHTYIWGGDMRTAARVGVGLLGADLEWNADAGALKFVRVLRPETWETDIKAPLTMSHARVQEGEYLFAVNNIDLGAADSLDERLTNLAGKQVLLTVGPTPDRSAARDVQIETLASDGTLRYRDWCRRNREYVLEKSGGRFGYLHLPDMGGDGLAAFIRNFYPQIDTDGLVIDIRYNGGGFVSQMIIERLARKVIGYDQPRRGKMDTYPYRVHVGHKVVLINQEAGSDGDIFPAAFQTLHLGPVIGTRTWGGVNGIRGDKTFIDGGLSTQPEFAWWDPQRGWNLENHGVDPDIVVEFLPEDWIAGRDPQLDRGLAELERMVREKPVERPQPPPIPDKSRIVP